MHRNKPVTLNFKELSMKICGTQKTVHFIRLVSHTCNSLIPGSQNKRRDSSSCHTDLRQQKCPSIFKFPLYIQGEKKEG